MHMAAQNEDYCKEVVSLLLKGGARVAVAVDNVSVYDSNNDTCVGYIMRLRYIM